MAVSVVLNHNFTIVTLIACIRPDVHPVFFADTLLSSESGREVVLPSVGSAHRKVRSKTRFRAWGYDEKLVIIHDAIIIAWAGDFAAAKCILDGVSHFFEALAPSLQFFEAYLQANHIAELAKVSLIVAIREHDRMAVWRHRCEEWIIPPIGTIWMAGTGADRMKKYVRQFPTAILQAGNDLRVGIATSLFLGGSLLADEMRTGAPLSEGFGGAYEIASFLSSQPVKIDDFTFIFWFGEQQANGFAFQLPRKVMRRYQRDDQTCYYCVEFDPGKMPPSITKEEVFIWKRFLAEKAIPHGVQHLPSLNSQWQINVFCADNVKGPEIATHVSFRHLQTGHPVTFRDNRVGGEMLLGLDLEMIRETLLPLMGLR